MSIKNQLEIKNFNLVEQNKLFKSICLNAQIDGELVGYLKLKYIPQENTSLISDALGYIIFKSYFDDNQLIEDYQLNNKKNILCKIGSSYLRIPKEDILLKSSSEINILFDKFTYFLNENYSKQQSDFVNYWVNKPSIELVRVFSDKDTQVTDFSDGIGIKINRKPHNWQKKGIGYCLYESAIKWCSDNNLELWASKTRTEDAKQIWEKLEHLPNFLITFHNNTRNINLKEDRPSITIKIK